MPPKRTASGSPTGTPAKLPKSETKPETFSNSVKKRLQSSTRTGQACDRCKVRKIRCDGLTNGCSPCLQNNTECRTTDRITGRAAPRGYVESIEQQNRDQLSRIRELEGLLIQNGIEVKPSNTFQEPAAAQYYNNVSQNGLPSMWTAGPNSSVYATPTPSQSAPSNPQETNLFRALPAFRAGCPGDNYLGVLAGKSALSSIKGTALSILGMEIDITDFPSQDLDEPEQNTLHPNLYNKSYQAFLQSAFNVNPKLDKVKLPDRDEGITYAQWFFRVVNSFMPILHKGTFMAMLTRVYDDPTFRPTVAQTVMIHMVFAIMFFQYSVRNLEDSSQQAYLNAQSNLHYHYALGMFYDLSCSHTLEDAQAMVLICSHLRNFPKPGASWILSRVTVMVAMELGLHRSVKRWGPDSDVSGYEVEIRKRIFWTILVISITLSGKLGRPMPFRLEDFDVEIPEPMDDEVLAEVDLPLSQRNGKCLHSIGLQAFKVHSLYLGMFSTIYTVQRSPDTYIEAVDTLEAKIKEWRDGLPSELVTSSASNGQESRVFALYAELWGLEFRMLLRHPAVSMTQDAAFNAESMRICVECAGQMLVAAKQLQTFRSLDTTWYNSAVFVMAITTTLFAQWEKRNETTASDLAALRVEMDAWLNIMGDIGALLGSGTRLREAVRVVTDGTIGLLSRNLQSKAAAEHSKSPSHPPHPPQPQNANTAPSTTSTTATPTQANQNTYPQPSPSNFPTQFPDNSHGSPTTSNAYLTPEQQGLAHQSTPYPAATQYYPDPPASSGVPYPPQEHSYTYTPGMSDSVEAPLLAAFAAQASQVPAAWPVRSNAPPNTETLNSSTGNGGMGVNGNASGTNGNPHSGSQSWQLWTSTMAGNLEPQDCYSASALMQLGGREMGGGSGDGGGGAEMAQMGGGVMGGQQQQQQGGVMGDGGSGTGGAWPLNIFDIGNGGGGA
ncbi:hypothetical protein VE03_05256 [Pseudogymnoascus sp. 23342-1-I1]|nr:hypothetical protein VE03_05256 [Pseudogymnoascus sp. 23342-1-I1]